ncbi:MAG TPA: hypothetical protein VJ865_06220 [Gemmatimonadaceae bacterium]|nr:hypothetical protein [Gemmatimonadaceae bacterium]
MKIRFVLLAVLCSACYEYSAFQPSQTSVGKPVRVQLTETGTQHVTALVGPAADYFDGNLAAMTDSTYTIALSDVGRTNGAEESWKGEPVTLNRSDAESIALRKASPGKSAGMTALLVGGAALIGRAIGGISGTGVTKPNGSGSGQ